MSYVRPKPITRNPELAKFEREWGIHLPGAMDWLPEEYKFDFQLACDAQPVLTTVSNSGIPSWLTTLVDPQVYEVLFSPLAGAEIIGEQKRGDWLMETAMFPVVERTGQVASYGDFSPMGRAGINTQFVQRQSYLYQITLEYGQRETERMGLAKINYVAELQAAGAFVLNRFQNLSYHFGIAQLECYGLLNDPGIPAAVTPATKAYGGVKWVNSNQVVATANEIYNDIQTLYIQLVQQMGGLVNKDTPMVVVLPNTVAIALTATNTFNVNVVDLLQKNFGKIRFVTDTLYSTTGGNVVQMIAETVEGQKYGYCAFNEKLRAHPIIPDLSSWKQKRTQGTWGAIIRQPYACAQMLGV